MYIKKISTDDRLVGSIEGTFLIIFIIALVAYIVILYLHDKHTILYSDVWVYNNDEVNRVAGEIYNT